MAKKVKMGPSRLSKYFSRLLVLSVITLVLLILLKSNTGFRDFVYKKVFQNNMSFAKINEVYNKYLGSSLPLKDNKNNTAMVSAEKLEYSKAEKYKDGVKLTVDKNYLVPVMDSGLIIFAGEKEGYGNTIVVQRPDNIEVWYCNLNQTSVSLYDYVKKGQIIGEVKETTMYIVFIKEGKALDYKEYL